MKIKHFAMGLVAAVVSVNVLAADAQQAAQPTETWKQEAVTVANGDQGAQMSGVMSGAPQGQS